MAVWPTGISWAPPAEMMKNNYSGALEHIAHNFGQWAQRLCRARAAHQDDPKTKEAQIRSGAHKRGRHGLTSEEEENRNARDKARRNYYWAINLNSQLQELKGKKCKGKGYTGRKGNEKGKGKSRPPRDPLHMMTYGEQWWL